MDGAKGATLPLIRHDLGLSYGQVGLLASVPLLAGRFLELPMGVLAGQGLLVDVFTGFLALYLVDVANLTPAAAALAIAVR